MIAVDASVLVDVLTGDAAYGEASAQALALALSEGEVVISEAVAAEVQTLLDTRETVMDALNEFGIRFDAIQEAAAVRAGHMQRRYRDRGGRRERVVADFLIGAHALLQCKALITRDDGFFRDYFKGLRLIVPQAEH
ncbi:MAG: type II toxin-antitoxin system VapC family toxin [Burkholderiales bacterium]|jgi:predicted nucleic acid-binding protein|nr:type II toxin-antitoxin system VapC family toxin [Burkholderiales bacterium]MBW8890798.1 type II toxin-antitoxin system VapC family toxin [Burkholderiales bacterium]